MNTVPIPIPFESVPGFRWLGKTRLNVLSLTGILSLPWLGFYGLIGVFEDIGSPRSILALVFTALFAVTVGSWIHRARGLEVDLSFLLRVSDQRPSLELYSRLYGTPAANLRVIAVGAVVGVLLFFMGRYLGDNSPASVVVAEIVREVVLFQSTPDLIAWNYLAMLQFSIIGIALCIGIVGNFRHNQVFDSLARSVRVDPLNTAELRVVANPLIRALVAPVVVVAATGPMVFVSNGIMADGFYLLSLPLALLLMLIALSAGRVILIVRKRIQAAKQTELAIIDRFLSGEVQAMRESRIGSLQDGFTASEVLAYRDRINAIWDWPLYGHLPRMMFYLTIPPLAWAAAALVERVIDAALS